MLATCSVITTSISSAPSSSSMHVSPSVAAAPSRSYRAHLLPVPAPIPIANLNLIRPRCPPSWPLLDTRTCICARSREQSQRDAASPRSSRDLCIMCILGRQVKGTQDCTGRIWNVCSNFSQLQRNLRAETEGLRSESTGSDVEKE